MGGGEEIDGTRRRHIKVRASGCAGGYSGEGTGSGRSGELDNIRRAEQSTPRSKRKRDDVVQRIKLIHARIRRSLWLASHHVVQVVEVLGSWKLVDVLVVAVRFTM